nr:Uncharacterised protein [Klebsiella pneumoniae]
MTPPGHDLQLWACPDDLLATAQQWREKMVSAAAEASDALMDKYRKPASWTRRRSSPVCASAR